MDCFVGNVAETFWPFLAIHGDELARSTMIDDEVALAERTVLWGGRDKISIAHAEIPTVGYLHEEFGYAIEVLYPRQMQVSLSDAVAADEDLVARLVQRSQRYGSLSVSPYATTSEFAGLVSHLRGSGCQLTMRDCVGDDHEVRIRDRFETKQEFRRLAAELAERHRCRVPKGLACDSFTEVPRALHGQRWESGRVIVKADDGEGGFGNIVLSADQLDGMEPADLLMLNPLLKSGPVVVEEYIDAPEAPSVEFFVPVRDADSVSFCYACNQVLDSQEGCMGVTLSDAHKESPWLAPLINFGLEFGAELQRLGYAGYFDIDALATAAGEVYVLESNLRRTGGTHVFDFCQTVFGTEYSSIIYATSQTINIVPQSPGNVLAALDAILLRSNGQSGIVPVVIGQAPLGSVNIMAVGRHEQEAMMLMTEAVRCLC